MKIMSGDNSRALMIGGVHILLKSPADTPSFSENNGFWKHIKLPGGWRLGVRWVPKGIRA